MSKLLKSLFLYLDETEEPDGFNILKHISKQLPNRDSLFSFIIFLRNSYLCSILLFFYYN